MNKYILAIFITIFFSIGSYCADTTNIENEKLAKSLIETIKHFEDNSLDSAFIYVNKLLEITETLPDSLRAYSYTIIGEMYDNASIFDIAFQYFEKAMELIPKGDPMLPYLYSEIGEFYTSFADFEKARHYLDLSYSKALQLRVDSIDLIDLYYDYGTYYWEIEEYDSSVIFMELAAFLTKSKMPVDYGYLLSVNAELVQVYMYKDNFISAKKLINEIDNYPENFNYSKYSKAYRTFVKGVYAINTNDISNGVEKLKEVLIAAEGIGLEVERSNINQYLIDIFIDLEDYESAFEHQKLKSEIDKNIINNQNKARVAALEILHESDKKDQTIQTHVATIGQREKVIWASLGILILISILSFSLFRTVKAIRSKNKHIETLMRELHHRVKNNLQVISSLLGLQSMKLDDPNAKKAVEDSKSRVKAMSMIHQRLYQNEGIALINFDTYVEELIQDLKHSYMPDSEVKIELEIPQINFDVDTTLPLGLIINELISNSFKYAFDDINEPILKVELINQERNYTLKISDNGKGLKEELSIENSNSFGLKLVNLLVKQLKGSIAYNTNNGMNYQIQFSN